MGNSICEKSSTQQKQDDNNADSQNNQQQQKESAQLDKNDSTGVTIIYSADDEHDKKENKEANENTIHPDDTANNNEMQTTTEKKQKELNTEEEEKKEANIRITKIAIEDRTTHYFLNPHNLDPEQDRDVVSILALSDTLGTQSMEIMSDIPPVDILVHAGNFTQDGTLQQIKDFNAWLNQMLDTKKCRYAIVIAGNHDIGFDGSLIEDKLQNEEVEPITVEGVADNNENANEEEAEAEQEGFVKENEINKVTTAKSDNEINIIYTDKTKECRHNIKNAIYLQDEGIEILGLKFYGTPWNRVHDDKGGNKYRAFCVATEDELKKCYHNIPYDVDVMLTHYPPYLHNDIVDGEHVGSKALIEKLYKDTEPKVCIFGHITTCCGVTTQEKMEDTAFMNVNCSNEESQVAKKPILFYVQPKLESFF